MSEGVAIALIGLVGITITALGGLLGEYLKNKRIQKELVEYQQKVLDQRKTIKEQQTKVLILQNQLATIDLKSLILDRIMDLALIDPIKAAVEEVFAETKATRFLVLVAINGKTDFNYVSAIIEVHKDARYPFKAIATYQAIEIDAPYKEMIRQAERGQYLVMETEKMTPQKLKGFYAREGVKHSVAWHLLRRKLTEDDDLMCFSTMATHNEEPFTPIELTAMQVRYEGVIKQMIKRILNFE